MEKLTRISSLDITVESLGIDEVFMWETADFRVAPFRLALEMSSWDCVLRVCVLVLRFPRPSSLEVEYLGIAEDDEGLGIPEYFAITAAAAADACLRC